MEKEKNRLRSSPGDGSSLASSFGVGSSLASLCSSGLESQENDGFSSICEDSSTVLEVLQEDIDSKFTPKKERSSFLASTYFDLGYFERSISVADCGSFLQFNVSNGLKKLVASNFCRDRLCPMCNWRRSLKIFGQVSQIMNVLETQGYDFLFLTLTLRNSSIDNYPDMVQQLFDGWRFFYHKHPVVKKTILGMFRSIETTINQKSHTFHAHIHCPIAVRSNYFHQGYITQAQWSDMWRESCKIEYNPIVDVRRFKPKPGASGIGSAVAEAVKYSVKDYDFLVDSDFWRPRYVQALLDGLYHRRLTSMTGCFKKVYQQLQLDDPESGDLLDVDDVQLRDDVNCMMVRYGWKNGVYVKI